MTTIEIPLFGGGVVLIDESDLPLVAGYEWRETKGYALLRFRSRVVPQRMHTLLTGWTLTDHINGDRLDNRRANLRPASPTQNAANSILRRDNTSGFKGVAWFKRDQCWHVTIRINCKKTHIGYFKDPAAGALAYDAAARKQFGEFASVNFPEPGERGARY